MSSGWHTSVARPAQYTPVAVASPTQSSARANASVAPTGTSSPVPRRTRANVTARRSGAAVSVLTSVVARRRAHEIVEAVAADARVVFVVFEDRPERRVDRAFVEARRAER